MILRGAGGPRGGSAAWTRRRFLGTVAVGGGAALLPGALAGISLGRRADGEAVRVGFLSPAGASAGPAEESALLGARLAAEEAARAADLFGRGFGLLERSAGSPEAVGGAVGRLVDEGAVAVVGGLEERFCLALAEAAEAHRILYLNVGCAAQELRGARCGPHTFSVAASDAMYADALALWLVGERGLGRWFFLVPETESGRSLQGIARRALQERGGEEVGSLAIRPEGGDFAEAFRRLRDADVDVAFLAFDGPGRLPFLEEYSRRGLRDTFQVAGISFDIHAFRAGDPATHTGIWPALWHHGLFRYGAETLNRRFSDRFDRPMDGAAWASWLAVKAAWESSLRAPGPAAPEVARFLVSERAGFDGHKGARLTFRPWNHQLRQPVYLLGPAVEAGPEGPFEAVAELPGERGEEESPRERLDALGEGREETACRLAHE